MCSGWLGRWQVAAVTSVLFVLFGCSRVCPAAGGAGAVRLGTDVTAVVV